MKQTRNIARHALGLTLVLIVATFALESVALAQVNPTWTPTGNLNIPRVNHTATLLANGKVLVVGGYGGNRPLNNPELSAELYDPVTGSWSVTGGLGMPRLGHTATLLPNGKVLVAGGAPSSGSDPSLNSAELYDPNTGQWSPTGNLNTGRQGHTATLLQDGKVLVAGGFTGGATNGNCPCFIFVTNSAEIYDPATGIWSVIASLNTERGSHTATVLQNGEILVAGGTNGGINSDANTVPITNAELYDPRTGRWSVTASLNAPRESHTATLLPDGKVLAAAGDYTETVELYDPSTGVWSFTGSLTNAGSGNTATLLPDGKVLVVGGGWGGSSLNTAELYDPNTGTWSATASPNTGRSGHTATLLQNGNVVVAGGCNDNCFDSLISSAELYNSHRPAPVDFDGDGKSDITVYRDGVWYVMRSSDGGQTAVGWGGEPQDKPVPGDYDGDGKTDIAVYRDGTWFIKRSSDEGITTTVWGGIPQDIPVPGHYDGDGKTDIAVYRDGTWFIRRSSDNLEPVIVWGGAPQDIPVPGDYDGDGKTDIAVYRDGTWFIKQSSDNLEPVIIWGGMPQDIPVPGDYDGDGKTDIAVYRDGTWFIKRSSDNLEPVIIWGGMPQDIPVPGDYDGDGKTDIAVYRDGTWFIKRSSDEGLKTIVLGGAPQDIPLK
jgi:N-acetylneuraminic acid mutarotase/(2Fe-2S) ferredoxin